MREDDGLLRVIGVRRLTASIINATIGAGIFVLPATAAADLGPAAPLAYIVCAVAMALIVRCFASAGSRVSLTGGLFAYIEVAFGPLLGFLGGLLYWLSAAFGAASVASAFAGSIAAAWPGAATPLGRATILLGLFAVLAFVNVRGTTLGARLIEFLTVAKLAPLLILLSAGIWFVHGENLAVTALPGAPAVGRTAIVLIFAFVGVELALVPSGEIADPARTVPRAVFLALAITTTMYLVIQVVAQGLLGASMSSYAEAPLAEAAARVLGPGGRLLVLAGATVSMFGYVAGDMLGSPRALFALGRDRMLPVLLARVHSRFHTPHVAIVTYAVIVAALAISGSFTQLAILSNVAVLTLYLIGVAASYALEQGKVHTGQTPFTTRGGVIVPVLAAAVIIWLLSQATGREIAIEAFVLSVASAFYLLRRRL